jgi:hypothetical protein
MVADFSGGEEKGILQCIVICRIEEGLKPSSTGELVSW